MGFDTSYIYLSTLNMFCSGSVVEYLTCYRDPHQRHCVVSLSETLVPGCLVLETMENCEKIESNKVNNIFAGCLFEDLFTK